MHPSSRIPIIYSASVIMNNTPPCTPSHPAGHSPVQKSISHVLPALSLLPTFPSGETARKTTHDRGQDIPHIVHQRWGGRLGTFPQMFHTGRGKQFLVAALDPPPVSILGQPGRMSQGCLRGCCHCESSFLLPGSYGPGIDLPSTGFFRIDHGHFVERGHEIAVAVTATLLVGREVAASIIHTPPGGPSPFAAAFATTALGNHCDAGG